MFTVCKLTLQVTSVTEENTSLTEMYLKIKNELETRELSLGSLVERFKEQLSDRLLEQGVLEQKLSYAEGQVEHHKRFLEEVTARNRELKR